MTDFTPGTPAWNKENERLAADGKPPMVPQTAMYRLNARVFVEGSLHEAGETLMLPVYTIKDTDTNFTKIEPKVGAAPVDLNKPLVPEPKVVAPKAPVAPVLSPAKPVE